MAVPLPAPEAVQAGTKRLASTRGQHRLAQDDAFVTQAEMRSSLSDLSSRLQAGFQTTMAKASTEINCLVSESVTDSIRSLQTQVDARCAATKARVDDLSHKVDATATELRTAMREQQKVIDQLLVESKDHKKRQEDLEHANAKVTQQVMQDVDYRLVEDPSYARPPNRTIVKLGTQPATPIDNIRQTCKAWLDPLFPEGTWQ
eukprot:1032965-Karenia_brevis.AAC.1